MNFKDKVTNVCGLVFAVGTAIAAIDTIPSNVRMIAGAAAGVAGAIVAYYTGKPAK